MKTYKYKKGKILSQMAELKQALTDESNSYIRNMLQNGKIDLSSHGIDDVTVGEGFNEFVNTIYLAQDGIIKCVTNLNELNFNDLSEMDKLNICTAVDKNSSILFQE